MPATSNPGTPRSFTEDGSAHRAIRGIGSEQERLHRFPAQGTHYQWRLEARGTATATRLGRTLRRQCHPVREALRWLESEGLLRYDAHKGSTVVQPEPGATREKYQIRAVLEGLATSLAAPKISDEDIRELESYNEQLADANRTPSQINDLNRTLHFRVYEMAGSPLLLALMRLLWQSFPQGPQVARPRDESVAEHKQLIEALRDRDAARAQAITQQHILRAIRYLEDELS